MRLSVLIVSLGCSAVAALSCSDNNVVCGTGTELVYDVCVSIHATGGASAGTSAGGSGAIGGGTASGAGGTASNLPPKFGGISSVSPASETSLLVTWDPANDDTTPPSELVYQVYVATEAGAQDFTKPLVSSAPGAYFSQLTGLDAGGTYHVVVRAQDADDSIDDNTVELSGTAQSDTTPPTFAGATGAATTSAVAVTVEWKAASDDLSAEAGIAYAIYWNTASGALEYLAPAMLTAPGATSALITLPTPDTAYFFGVRAFDAAGNIDDNTVEVSAATAPDTTPPVFAGCTGALTKSATEAVITWNSATDDASTAAQLTYHVYSATTPSGQDFQAAPQNTFNGAVNTGIVTGLAPATTHYFVCRAADEAGNADDNSAQVQALTLTDATPPTFAGLVSVDNPGANSLELHWNTASDNHTKKSDLVYDVYHALTTATQEFAVAPLATSMPGEMSMIVMGFILAVFQFFVVRARDQAGNSDSNTVEKNSRTLVSMAALQAVFTQSCAISGCHVGSAAPFGLRLDTEFFTYNSLCGGANAPCSPVDSQLTGQFKLVQPQSPLTSWILKKIKGTHSSAQCFGNYCGDPMPPPSCLNCVSPTAEQIDLIESWITQGAPKL